MTVSAAIKWMRLSWITRTQSRIYVVFHDLFAPGLQLCSRWSQMDAENFTFEVVFVVDGVRGRWQQNTTSVIPGFLTAVKNRHYLPSHLFLRHLLKIQVTQYLLFLHSYPVTR